MARLTRTQKYADLRESLSNDNESSVQTEDLKNYENRLNNITETLSQGNDSFSGLSNNANMSNVAPVQEETNYQWPDFKDEPVEEEDPRETFQMPTLESVINNKNDDLTSNSSYLGKFTMPVGNAPVENTFAQEAPKTEFEEVKPDNSYLDYFTAPANNEPKTTNINNNFESYFNDINDVFASANNTVTQEDNNVVSHAQEAIDAATQYNQAKGEQNVSQIADGFINEIRNHQEEVPLDADEETNIVKAAVISAEDFTNTVSMEISKIMDEVNETPATDYSKPIEIEEEAIPSVKDIIVEEEAADVVEIKNITELEQENDINKQNTISETIPFVVASDDDEELVEEQEEETEGSNTVLNIILVILIVILVAVLGLIVFYILKTKGISLF